jgi:endonuclease YncB( thermonuclease family)
MRDVWVWDIYRANRFVTSVRVLTFKDVNVEELSRGEFKLPDDMSLDKP